MRLQDKVVVVTGGANGIGRALCRRFAAEGAKVTIADLKADAATALAGEIGATAIPVDVSSEAQVALLVHQVTRQHGAIDLFCSNAGVGAKGGLDASDEIWQRSWQINVMAHFYAARAVLPGMLARGQGYLLQTVSAAGLLTQLGSAPYAVTKHAALALAEWLSITYGDQGIRVSALCPQGVRTDMLRRAEFGGGSFLLETALEPEQVAEAVVQGLEAERFLILPHPEVAEYFQRKAGDYERWLRGMRRLQANMQPLEPQL
jgi:NAD(P)-dependent dehydrogenase (short-subunit alcohol dehydrogenase family)